MLQGIEKYPRKKSWAKSVKNLLENLGFNNVWLFQGVGNINMFLTLFNQRLNDQFIQEWNENLNNSTRADTYRLFATFSFKQYLDQINIKKFRTAVTRLRVSSHRLEVETGRWHKPNKIPKHERKCQLCNSLEDEFHFIIECPLYHDFRELLINKYFWRRPNILKFIELMQSENVKIMRNVSIFLFKSFKKRNETYYFT